MGLNYNIVDDLGAEKALKGLKDYKQERERLIEICKQQIHEYNAKIEEYESEISVTESELKNVLKDYMSQVETKETKTQFSYKLPSAQLIYKKPSVDIVKCEEMLLKNIDEKYIKTTKKVDWANFKKNISVIGENAVDEDGVVIEGLSVVEKEGEFKIKF